MPHQMNDSDVQLRPADPATPAPGPRRFPYALLGLYAVVCGVSAIKPWDFKNWLMEMALAAAAVVVRAEETTELLPLPLVEPGAVALAADPDVCGDGELPVRLWVRRTEAPGEGGRTGASVIDQRIEALPCDRELEGLEPGEYTAALVQPSPSGEADGLSAGISSARTACFASSSESPR